MSRCPYTYCRAEIGERETCPRCGFPRAPEKLRDPRFLASIEVEDKPPALYDMHQILPAVDGVYEAQRMMMRHLGVRRVLLQSAPPQASSLWGDEKLLGLAREHPDAFWASQFLDPRQPDAVAAVERIAESGARVVKLLSVAGYRPDDDAFDPAWAAMERLGLVAMAHTGFITARHKAEEKRAGAYLSSRYADPLLWDRPARKFPELQIILCHTGGAIWYEAAAQMVTQHENVWGDVSGFGIFALERLLRVEARIDWTKVFWGNDSPPFAYPINLRLHLDVLRRFDALELAPGLCHDHAERFAQRFLDRAA